MASVLIVEDNVALGRLLTRTLTSAGHEAAWAASGQEALAASWCSSPDVVLVDMHLGDMSSLELAESLRQRLPEARLLAMSGEPQTAAACRSFERFLLKPLSLGALLDVFADPADAGG